MEKAENKDRQYQGLNALATAVENPCQGTRILDVPAIRRQQTL